MPALSSDTTWALVSAATSVVDKAAKFAVLTAASESVDIAAICAVVSALTLLLLNPLN